MQPVDAVNHYGVACTPLSWRSGSLNDGSITGKAKNRRVHSAVVAEWESQYADWLVCWWSLVGALRCRGGVGVSTRSTRGLRRCSSTCTPLSWRSGSLNDDARYPGGP